MPRVYGASFGRVPDHLLRNREVSANAKLLYALLTRYADQFGKAWPSVDRLADDMGWSESTAHRALKELVACEAVRVIARAGSSNLYFLQADAVLAEADELLPQGTEGVSDMTPRGVTHDTPGVSDMTPRTKPLNEANIERPSKRASLVPEDFQPSETARQWARRKGFSDDFVAKETEKFVNWNVAKRKLWSNHEAAWRNWLIKAAEMRPKEVQATPRYKPFETPCEEDGPAMTREEQLAQLRKMREERGR